MTVTKIDRSIIFFLTITNFALIIMVWGTLRVSPSDVLAEVKTLQYGVESNREQIAEKIDAVQMELNVRGEWMKTVDSELMQKTADRIHRSEIETWRQQLASMNQSISVPELPERAD